MESKQMQRSTFWSRNFNLQEPFCDKDGLYNGCLAPPEQARILYWMSWWGMITGLIGIWYGYRWLGTSVCIGSLFAQLYWHHPSYSWRRTVDIAWVQFLIWSHLWVALGSSQALLNALIQLFGALSYGVSWYFTKKGETWSATFAHTLVHVCANTSLFILYTS